VKSQQEDETMTSQIWISYVDLQCSIEAPVDLRYGTRLRSGINQNGMLWVGMVK